MTDATWLPVYESPHTTVIDNEWEAVEPRDLARMIEQIRVRAPMTDGVVAERYAFYVHAEMHNHLRERLKMLRPDGARCGGVGEKTEAFGFSVREHVNIPVEWVVLMNPQRVTNGGDVLEPIVILENASTDRTLAALHGGEERESVGE